MPRIQIINRVKQDEYAFDNLLNYIAKEDHCSRSFIGASNMYISDYSMPEPYIGEQIEALLDMHGAWNKRRALHVFITFNDEERAYLTEQMLIQITYEFVQQAFPCCMTYFAVHDISTIGEVKLHVHIMLIPINIYTGQTWSAGVKGWYKVGWIFTNICAAHIPIEVLGKPNVKYGRTPRERRVIES